MSITVESSIVDGDSVTQIDPAEATFFDLLAGTTAGPQIAPSSTVPIFNPITGTSNFFVDGVAIGSQLGAREGSAYANAGVFGLADPADIDMSDEASLIGFTFEQSDGTQLVIRASITNGSGPTLQEFADGYTLEDLLTDADTVNGSAYTYEPVEEVIEIVNGTADGDELSGTDGSDTILGRLGDDTIDGGAGPDRLRGGVGNDDISGGAGGDVLGGGQGRDTLSGDGGNDILFGGNGHDVLNGGAGNDRLLGGKGNDTATGGEGADTFVFKNKTIVDGQTDVVTDFEVGTDTIEMANTSFDELDITDGTDGAEIAIGDYTIVLEGVAAADLSASDFDFV